MIRTAVPPKRDVTLIIEHLEEKLTEWLLLEYRNASKWWNGRVIYTNVRSEEDVTTLKPLGEVRRERFLEVVGKDDATIILDPMAKETLRPEDFNGVRWVVIGGICGDVEFDGRTSRLISSTSMEMLRNIRLRNLGKVHFPIDQAAVVARLIMEGKRLDEIDVRVGVEIVLEEGTSFRRVVELPYGYVVLDGKIQFADGFVEFLKRGWDL